MPVQLAISLTDKRASCSTTIFTGAMLALVTEVLGFPGGISSSTENFPALKALTHLKPVRIEMVWGPYIPQNSLNICFESILKKGKRKVQGVPQSQNPDPKRKRKPTNLNKHKPNKRTKSTKISSLFPKRGNRNTKRTEKHKNKMTHGKTYKKSPCRINYKATKSKTNTGTTALERSVEQTTAGFKALLQLANFTLGPDATLNTEIHKNSVRIKAPNSVNASNRKHKNQINHYNKQRRVLLANSTVC